MAGIAADKWLLGEKLHAEWHDSCADVEHPVQPDDFAGCFESREFWCWILASFPFRRQFLGKRSRFAIIDLWAPPAPDYMGTATAHDVNWMLNDALFDRYYSLGHRA